MSAQTSWTLYSTTQTGEQIRKSYYAVGTAGVMYRESVIYNDTNQQGSKPFQPSPQPTNDADAMYCAEASAYVPGTTNAGQAPLTWTLQSQKTNGNKIEELWSAPTPTGATTAGFLYRTLTYFLDKSTAGASPFRPSPAPVTQDRAKNIGISLVVGS